MNSELSARVKSDYSCNVSPSDHLVGGTGSWWRDNRKQCAEPNHDRDRAYATDAIFKTWGKLVLRCSVSTVCMFNQLSQEGRGGP